MHANEEVQSKGIPLHEVPQIRDIWLARREELGLGPPSKPWNDSPSPPGSPTKLSGSKGKEVNLSPVVMEAATPSQVGRFCSLCTGLSLH
ncbi:hypothetical protein VP01_288g4 [Puccinia sorghi]|uniref:Uncharacterized protein n=1 Tax=Puccinia sorghi TaxID=27349 RepID=A0A0L6V1N6_9BASI|nr:hypothetical protein VP01_288g4 [Puccinia sorghi]